MATILIVDDETEIREMLKQLFILEGYMVYTAKDGTEALNKVSQLEKSTGMNEMVEKSEEGIDIILLDVNMPEPDGYEVCRRIREHISCPILFLTARIEEEDKVKGFRAGGDDYIEKPFSMVELKERVAAHLRRQNRERMSESVGFAGAFTISYSGRKVLYEKELYHLQKQNMKSWNF